MVQRPSLVRESATETPCKRSRTTGTMTNLTTSTSSQEETLTNSAFPNEPFVQPPLAAHQQHITDNLDELLAVLPPSLLAKLEPYQPLEGLFEIVLDLGRIPEARFADRVVDLGTEAILAEDIDFVVQHIGVFGKDNRAGIERTLHRISAIRSRSNKVVGLTCRIGRAVYGTIDIIQDVVESGKSACA